MTKDRHYWTFVLPSEDLDEREFHNEKMQRAWGMTNEIVNYANRDHFQIECEANLQYRDALDEWDWILIHDASVPEHDFYESGVPSTSALFLPFSSESTHVEGFDPRSVNFVEVGALPFAPVACAVLLAAKSVYGDAMKIASDLPWSSIEWRLGVIIFEHVTGERADTKTPLALEK